MADEIRTLAALFADYGQTVSTMAALVEIAYPEVTADLFERVDQGVQPLPSEVAQTIAAALGLTTPEVLGRARFVTYLAGPDYRKARPPDFGAEFNSPAYHRTAGT